MTKQEKKLFEEATDAEFETVESAPKKRKLKSPEEAAEVRYLKAKKIVEEYELAPQGKVLKSKLNAMTDVQAGIVWNQMLAAGIIQFPNRSEEE